MVIVEVFKGIFIGNVHDANDVYKLVQLNIGGVLSCVYCNQLNWCSEKLEVPQIYYKHNFLNCKKKLSRFTGKISPDEIEEDLEIKEIEKIKKKEENNNNEGNSEIECHDKNHSYYYFTNQAHYDFIAFPSEVKTEKIDKAKTLSCINLLTDVEANKTVDFCFPKGKNSSDDKLRNLSKIEKGVSVEETEQSIKKEENEKENKKEQLANMLKCEEANNENKDIGDAVSAEELNDYLKKENQIPIPNVHIMKHLYLNIEDTFDENILVFVEKAHEFIDSTINENKNILIHCLAGISRCSTIILSYVSKKNKKGIEENFISMKKKYPFAHPNDHFYQQLLLYEKMNYTLHVTDSECEKKQ